ncbi:DUF2218 domain-containing protein [Alcanivorax sp. 24]|uniref:DUF2218 domain-containing protein n=1 Tax=Alcanivorax sp. 24 TaxID=2545266 RepID=UPI00105D428F|nr:DUF2218 domain-containing protein [Alcanivorax sp. 24]
MIELEGQVETTRAPLYLTKLCKHFQHKVEVEFDEHQARVDFPFGECRLHADQRRLRIHGRVMDQAAAERMRYVIDDHLRRFARQEQPRIQWRETDR